MGFPVLVLSEPEEVMDEPQVWMTGIIGGTSTTLGPCTAAPREAQCLRWQDKDFKSFTQAQTKKIKYNRDKMESYVIACSK